jgi:MOSC domain-containing protein YiiM
MTARLASVNVVRAIVDDPLGSVGRTAIDKRPVPGPVRIGPYGLAGDTVMDHDNHGGLNQAVYAYAAEDIADWSGLLGREIAPGTFGENLTTAGLDVTGAVIGETWEIESAERPEPVVLQVVSPRIPCRTFQAWMGEPHWVKRFTDHGAPGAYLRVLAGGKVQAGAEVTVASRPGHGVTIGQLFRRDPADAADFRRLQEDTELPGSLVSYLRPFLVDA